jgi:methylenetetrahydrofolate--tRNA-(uracil-5-)-methyltransferase
MMKPKLHNTPVCIIGGGLAGCEAAWQLAERGVEVHLADMKPVRFSPAHESEQLAELVCSNSFRSDDPHSAVGLLKNELRMLNSLIMHVADQTAVPAGKALAVDRALFGTEITRLITAHPRITITREEVTTLPPASTQLTILAAGPLISDALAGSLAELTGEKRLFFYDAIAPIVYAESLDMEVVYQKSRYDDGPGDYLNCPMDERQYQDFIKALAEARCSPLRDFEEAKYFEGCLPIEVINQRGADTLRYGPMKPVGLEHPVTGDSFHAVVQLRKENQQGTLYNMVGFQTKLTWPEQKRVFRMIPGLGEAEFARLGSIHRNTFICAPEVLHPTLQSRARPNILIAGQLSGVEGYVESTAMGLLAGLNCCFLSTGSKPPVPPSDTGFGALVRHLTQTNPASFQPSNINFGLFPPWEKKVPKRLRGKVRAERSDLALEQWLKQLTAP